jgi:hypothetical protein
MSGQDAEALAAELSQNAMEALRKTAQQHRQSSLEAFAPIVRSELQAYLRGKFSELPEPWIQKLLEELVTVSPQRIEIAFDEIAKAILHPHGRISRPLLGVVDTRNQRWKDAEARVAASLRASEPINPQDLAIIDEEQAKFDAMEADPSDACLS